MRVLLWMVHGAAVCMEGAAVLLATVPTVLAMLFDAVRVWSRGLLERL